MYAIRSYYGLSTGGISKGVNRFVHNATFVPKGMYYMNGTKLWDSTIGNKGIYGWTVHNALYPGQLLRGNATDKALGKLRVIFSVLELIKISSAKSNEERKAAEDELIFYLLLVAPFLAPGRGNHGLHQKLW
ncbi:hypothetical protein [Leptospira noguchii]|uniref:hypothetical protein n=1 Tax=Leptospira noguchii TaxID=28182 RepID=UPI0012F8BFDB|nr:hypothetical protein [Leptospira noguchii]